MPTFTALTILSGKENADAFGEAMERLIPEPTGVGMSEVEGGSDRWEVAGYFLSSPDVASLALLSAGFKAEGFTISELPDVDWVSKVRGELTPVQAGRFFVYGSHDADKVPDGAQALLVDAAMAFGTGHHGTTLGCLLAVDRLMDAGFLGKNVADIGCGTAVLAMAAARVWPNVVLASDIDAVAVEVAETNVDANGLTGQVRCLVAVGFDHPEIQNKAPFDLIFANILKSPLIALAPDMAACAANGGYIILSGLLNEQATEVIATYNAHGFNVAHHAEIGDWSTLTMQRASRRV